MAQQIEPFYGEVGRRVQRLRGKAGLTQEQVGAKLHPQMTRASIANIETGKQRVLAKTLVDLAGVLGAEVADLLPPPVERGKQKPVDLQAELAKALPPDAAIDDLAKTIRGGQRRQKT